MIWGYHYFWKHPSWQVLAWLAWTFEKMLQCAQVCFRKSLTCPQTICAIHLDRSWIGSWNLKVRGKNKKIFELPPPTWRIIPWLGYVVNNHCDRKSSKDRVVGPLPNCLFMACKWGLLTTYNTRSSTQLIIDGGEMGICWATKKKDFGATFTPGAKTRPAHSFSAGFYKGAPNTTGFITIGKRGPCCENIFFQPRNEPQVLGSFPGNCWRFFWGNGEISTWKFGEGTEIKKKIPSGKTNIAVEYHHFQ